MINSFDLETDFDSEYFQLDLTGDSSIGYANYGPANISHDGEGAIEIEYSAHNSEGWGGFTKLSHFHPDPDSVYDFSDLTQFHFGFTMKPLHHRWIGWICVLCCLILAHPQITMFIANLKWNTFILFTLIC